MKKRSLLLITLIAVIAQVYFANAQKLPNIQITSLRAPANLKVDGKASEWDGQFQAYNKNTDIFYTIANDDENLYLVVQAKDPRVIEKILDVGVAFTVNNTGKKNDKAKENVAITYPLISDAYTFDILRKAGDKANWSGRPPAQAVGPLREVLTRTDSTVALANKALDSHSKEIHLKGVLGIKDSVISVYNEYGIKAVATFNNSGAYIYELAVPLKYIGLSIDQVPKFAYSIKLNGADTGGYFVDRVTKQQMDSDPDLNTPTEFWGDCTLAKK